jgi:tripartite-type tricarboxylate transporter receptor subunit TctC
MRLSGLSLTCVRTAGALTLLCALGLIAAGSSAAVAQPSLKDLTIYIGYSPGGNYDVYGRIIGRHIGRHLPGNPTVVVKNMDGAGSLKLTKYLYTTAPKDGSVIGVVSRGSPFGPLLNIPGADYDATKFNWLGSTNDEVSVCAFWHESGVKDWRTLREKSVSVGGTGPSSDNEQYPRIINAIFGTKMKIISGYPGGNNVDLAIERREVDGRCSWSWSSVKAGHASWVTEGKIVTVLQLSLTKHPDLPNVPLITDIAENAKDRALLEAVFARQRLAWPFVAPPDMPADRVKMLRDAFEATMNDPEFIAEADKMNLEHVLVKGADIEQLIARVYSLPEDSVQRLRTMLK